MLGGAQKIRMITVVEDINELERNVWIFTLPNYDFIIRFYCYRLERRESKKHKFKPIKAWNSTSQRCDTLKPDVPASIKQRCIEEYINGLKIIT